MERISAAATAETQRDEVKRHTVSEQLLRDQNQEVRGYRRRQCRQQKKAFVPAFQNTRNGRCVVSRFADGKVMPHSCVGWTAGIGSPPWMRVVMSLQLMKPVIAGFLHDGRFIPGKRRSKPASFTLISCRFILQNEQHRRGSQLRSDSIGL